MIRPTSKFIPTFFWIGTPSVKSSKQKKNALSSPMLIAHALVWREDGSAVLELIYFRAESLFYYE